MSALVTFGEGVRIAGGAIRANWIRSGLTVLGVAVGVAVVMAIAAMVTGIRSSIMAGFEAAGPDNFIVTRFDFTAVRILDDGNGRPPWWDKPELTPAEAERVAEVASVREALYTFTLSVDMTFEGRRVRGVQSRGYSAGWPAYLPGTFLAGRDFTPAEVRHNRAVVVLSAALAEELFGQRDPVGRRVRMGSAFRGVAEDFAVVGVFEPEPNIFVNAVPHWAVFPYTAGLKRLKASGWDAQILVVPGDAEAVARVQDDVIAALRSLRGLRPVEENDFALLQSAQLMELFDRLTGVFFLFMFALSSAGLMVGGVGVVGIMLISVTERTREIGIRKAVGATRREILWQFLVEATVLTVLGGALGLALGGLAAEVVARLTPIPAETPLWSVVLALGAAAVTGILFGLLPALRASRLDPVAALRAE